jgi:hypothetical protein
MRIVLSCLLGVLVLGCFVWAQAADRFDSGNSTGIPTYPRAIASDHTDGRGTVSLADGTQAHRVAAVAYFASDRPEKVLQFYRDRLKSSGQVTECSGGKNTSVDVQLDEASFADPSACNPDAFANSGTELKVSSNGEQKIVVVLPHGSGSEIALVSVRK